jgi:hypothetical protein
MKVSVSVWVCMDLERPAVQSKQQYEVGRAAGSSYSCSCGGLRAGVHGPKFLRIIGIWNQSNNPSVPALARCSLAEEVRLRVHSDEHSHAILVSLRHVNGGCDVDMMTCLSACEQLPLMQLTQLISSN